MRYLLIEAWGAYMGSASSYVEGICDLAREDGAPADAIYRYPTGGITGKVTTDDRRRFLNPDGARTWALWDEFISPIVKQHILGEAERIGLPMEEVRALMAGAEAATNA